MRYKRDDISGALVITEGISQQYLEQKKHLQQNTIPIEILLYLKSLEKRIQSLEAKIYGN